MAVTERVGQTGGIDTTGAPTRPGAARASRRSKRLRQAVRGEFGGYEKGIAVGVQMRHDHGPPLVSYDFQGGLSMIGIES